MLIRFIFAAGLAFMAWIGPVPADAKLPAGMPDRAPACLELSQIPRLVGTSARLQPIPPRYVTAWYAAVNEAADTAMRGDGMVVAVLSTAQRGKSALRAGSGVIFMATAGCITKQITLAPRALRRLVKDVQERSRPATAHNNGS